MIPKEYLIATRAGFIEVFWDDLNMGRRAGEKLTQQDVFWALEDLYECTYNRELFPSFEAFKMALNYQAKKRPKK